MPTKPDDDAVQEAARALTVKQRRWADALLGAANGNGAEAARIAGYRGGHRGIASENRTKPHIRAYLEALVAADDSVADRRERMRHLTKKIRNPLTEDRDQLKANELLGKMAGDFVKRIRLEALTDEELAEEARRRLAAKKDDT
jgi:phage terminase small subunit